MNSENPTKRAKVEEMDQQEMSDKVVPENPVIERKLAETIEQFFENPEFYIPAERFLSTWIEDETPLTQAIKIQNEKAVRALIEIRADVNQQNKRGITPISAASHKGSLSILKALIDAGADVNATNSTGSTALIQASHFGHFGAVQLLLQAHAFADLANIKGTTALMRASQEGHVHICALLIKYGADVNRKNNEGMNSLMLASQRGHAKMVQLLIYHKASMDDQTGQGSTALMLACKRGHLGCVEVLVSKGADIYAKDIRNRNARDTATRKDHLQLLRVLDTQVQLQLMRQDVRSARTALLMKLRYAHAHDRLQLTEEENRATKFLRSVQDSYFLSSASGNFTQGTPTAWAATTETAQVLNTGILPYNGENHGSILSSSKPTIFIFDGNSLVKPLGKSILLAEMSASCSAESLPRSSVANTILSSRSKYVEWEWHRTLLRCMMLPAEIFQHIVELMPLPRLWHWSIMRLRKHVRLVPQIAVMDICMMMDEIISDACIFKGKEQRRLLAKINANPEVHVHLNRTWGMDSCLIDVLCKESDIQSLCMRTTDSGVVFKSPIVRELLLAAIELFRWHRYRTSANKMMTILTDTPESKSLFSRIFLSDPAFGSPNLVRSSFKAVIGEVDATDYAIDELSDVDVALDQDTENEMRHDGERDDNQDDDSDDGGLHHQQMQSRQQQQQLHHQQQQQHQIRRLEQMLPRNMVHATQIMQLEQQQQRLRQQQQQQQQPTRSREPHQSQNNRHTSGN